jgi:CheY-like chemotaxis protein
MLVSREPELLRPTKFTLERQGFSIIPVVREPQIAGDLPESGVDIIVLDVAFSLQETGRMVERVKSDPRFEDTVLILFSKNRAELQRACLDRGVLKDVDDVLVEVFDDSELIDRIKSAARRMRVGRSEHNRQVADWKDPYDASTLDDRREDERFNLNTPVIMRGKDLLGEPFEEETSMLNVSAGGACLKSEHYLEANTAVEIEITARQARGGDFEMRGAVVRMDQGTGNHEPKRRRVAVRFADGVRHSIDFHLLLAQLSGTGR